MALYDTIADLELAVDSYDVERRTVEVSTGFTRVTTTAVLHGRGEHGQGEDVAYTADDHADFPASLPLAGVRTLRALSALLDAQTLYGHEPAMPAAHDYRRWAFESAALDLALRQAGLSLARAVGRDGPAGAVRGLDARAISTAGSRPIRRSSSSSTRRPRGTPQRSRRLAATGRVRVLDLKALLPRHRRRPARRPGLLPRDRHRRSRTR